jgi:hypothetical protein
MQGFKNSDGSGGARPMRSYVPPFNFAFNNYWRKETTSKFDETTPGERYAKVYLRNSCPDAAPDNKRS